MDMKQAREKVWKTIGERITHQSVSRLEELLEYGKKEIKDTVEFLFLDSITENIREVGIERKAMLCAYGIHEDGRKEVLSLQLVDVEDVEKWRDFLLNLKSRGLSGRCLKLIILDGNNGSALLKAIGNVIFDGAIETHSSKRGNNG